MKIPKYHLKAESKFTRFEFISEGNKGAIRKLIEFQATSELEFYNLAFGDKDPLTGDINDLAVTNNGDTEKSTSPALAGLLLLCTYFLTITLLLMFTQQEVRKLEQDFTEWV